MKIIDWDQKAMNAKGIYLLMYTSKKCLFALLRKREKAQFNCWMTVVERAFSYDRFSRTKKGLFEVVHKFGK